MYVLHIPWQLTSCLLDLPAGQKKKAHELSTQIKAEWAAMTETEREEATHAAVEKLKEAREMRKEGVHNVPITQFHDVRGTLSRIENEVSI